LTFKTPLLLRISNDSLCGGGMNIFWNHTLGLKGLVIAVALGVGVQAHSEGLINQSILHILHMPELRKKIH